MDKIEWDGLLSVERFPRTDPGYNKMIPAIRSLSFNVICHVICMQARLGMALDSLINSTTAAVNASLVHRSPDHQCRLFSRMQDLSSSFVGFRWHSAQENVKKWYEGCSISAVHALVLQSPPTASLSLLHPQDLVSGDPLQTRQNQQKNTHTHILFLSAPVGQHLAGC